jgi:plastocyanin
MFFCAIAVVAIGACTAKQAPPPASTGGKTVDAATAGTVTGRIVFQGTPPANDVLRMNTDRACLQSAGANPLNDAILVAADGAVQNVFVYVKDALDGYTFDVPSTPVVLNQTGCRYIPRVLGIRAGQPLDVLNNDPTLHNVHALPLVNQEFNQGTPFKGTHMTHVFTVPEVMVRFMCNVHGWMAAYVGVMAHPFFAVTDATGAFELKGLPPGTYTVAAWHEKFGTQTQQVTIGERQTQTIAFTFAGAGK